MAYSNPIDRANPHLMTAIGLMSGTSMDGIDVALIRTDGKNVVERGASAFYPYDPDTRKALIRGLKDAKSIQTRKERPGVLAELETFITLQHATAVAGFLAEHQLPPSQIDLIGFHGQTVLHRPEQALTVQLGDGQLLADTSGIPVVYDMRAKDMMKGGQGAPLVPIYHAALAAFGLGNLHKQSSIAFVNIGGISNITYIETDYKDRAPIAFDCGPGNAMLDQWVQTHAGIPYDEAGAIASEGRIVSTLANRYLAAPFFERAVPKSLDRFDFLPPEPPEANLEDGARTLAHVTAASIYKAADHLPHFPDLWVLCGGGRHHPAIVNDLKMLVDENGGRVVTAEEMELDGDAMEAEAFAYLAVRSHKRLPLTFPETTGCTEPTTGGLVATPNTPSPN